MGRRVPPASERPEEESMAEQSQTGMAAQPGKGATGYWKSAYQATRPQRSFLFAPGNRPRMVQKVITFGADAIILDLEDAVPIADKAATRGAIKDALLSYPQAHSGKTYVRVNSLDTGLTADDMRGVLCRALDGIILPKVESAEELRRGDALISEMEAAQGLSPGHIDLIPIIETARGFLNAQAIASAGTRVRRLAFGAGDFTFDLGVNWFGDCPAIMLPRMLLPIISRAAGLEPPFDTVYQDIRDLEGLRQETETAKALGFQGKMCIYPAQVAVVNEVFSPTTAEIVYAQKVLAAFDAAEAQGQASCTVDGKMIDYPLAERAKRVLAVAEVLGRSDPSLR
jgi:citrate lyase subunit beta/citryl-CoA lyase